MSELTIAIVSYNRGKYLDALLESLREECVVHRHKLIVVDNFSTERLVHDTLDRHGDIITTCVKRYIGKQSFVNDEYIAKNIVLEYTKTDKILFLQDDLQYIGYTGALDDYSNALMSSDYVCVTCNAVRRSTLNSTVNKNDYTQYENVKIYSYLDNHFHTMGFFKKEVFDKCGEYPTTWPDSQAFWGRSEDLYDSKVKQIFNGKKISGTFQIPLFCPVWNDPRGGYAFIRDNKRYGYYESAKHPSRLFYDKHTIFSFYNFAYANEPVNFSEIAVPLGWQYKTLNGDQIKYPQSKVLAEGPISDIF